MQNLRIHSTVQDGRNDTIQTSSLYRQALSTCVKSHRANHTHTQRRPMCVHVKPVIVAQPATFRRRFNLKKADWNQYSTEFDNLIEDVDPTPENYGRFIELMYVTSRKHMPRGCREQYNPGISEESQSLYESSIQETVYKQSI